MIRNSGPGPGTIGDRIKGFMLKGFCASHIIAEMPEVKATTIRVYISQLRRFYGINPRRGGFLTLSSLPEKLDNQIRLEADERKLPPGVLATLILEAVLRGDLIDAVLDDARFARKKGRER